MARYSLEGAADVCHVRRWAIYADLLAACRSASTARMDAFHAAHLAGLNAALRGASPTLRFYDSAWNETFALPFDPYERVMTEAAREIVSAGAPLEAIAWFARHAACVAPRELEGGLCLAIHRGHLGAARAVLGAFDLALAASSHAGSDIVRAALLQGDGALAADLVLRGGLACLRARREALEASERGLADGTLDARAAEIFSAALGAAPRP